jgi:hypothetical protein
MTLSPEIYNRRWYKFEVMEDYRRRRLINVAARGYRDVKKQVH